MRIIASGIIVICLPSLTLQSVGAEETSQNEKTALEVATADRAVASAGTGVEINASKDSSTVAIRMSRQVSKGKPIHDNKEAVFATWTLAASAPLNKTSDKTDIATLDSLVNASSLEFKYTRFRTSARRMPRPGTHPGEVHEEICDQARKAFARGTGKKANEMAECDSGTVGEYAADRADEFDALYWDPDKASWVWGGLAKVGYQSFKFFTTQSLEDQTQTKAPTAVQAFAGIPMNRMRALVAMGIDYQNGYKKAEEQTVCPQGNPGDPVTCKTGSVGKPTSDDREIVYLEGRTLWSWGAASLKVAWDFKADVFAADLPVYLVRDDKESSPFLVETLHGS